MTGSPQSIGAVIPFITTKVTLINTSNVDVLVGDGSTDDDIRIPANGSVSIAEGQQSFNNRTTNAVVFLKNTQLDITQVSGAGTGTIIINLLGID
ncbi:MAG: hypothetical protein PQJ44_06950 [Sphaerochaetaceae bacterium]|nr:hypothetical protein [Sphaerochaetaceae bacterium]